MATASAPRVLWKGAISFGLVHIPVALYSATKEDGLDFDWLDKRSMDPVGYKRINKRTGKEITKEHIVKGIAHGEGTYIVLTDEEIQGAYPKTTQTVEIEAFVGATEIPFWYLDRPYFVGPINKGQKVYALLRETLKRTNRIGIARVVIATKQHLAALIPVGPGLVLNLLRWGPNVRSMDALALPPDGVKAAGLRDAELKMAEQLVEDMAAVFKPEDYHDDFKDQILALVDAKAKAGKAKAVTQLEAPDAGEGGGADILDLTALLQRSLKRAPSLEAKAPVKASAKAPAKTPAKKAAAKKTPATKQRKAA